jgi:hypothetical protein
MRAHTIQLDNCFLISESRLELVKRQHLFSTNEHLGIDVRAVSGLVDRSSCERQAMARQA